MFKNIEISKRPSSKEDENTLAVTNMMKGVIISGPSSSREEEGPAAVTNRLKKLQISERSFSKEEKNTIDRYGTSRASRPKSKPQPKPNPLQSTGNYGDVMPPPNRLLSELQDFEDHQMQIDNPPRSHGTARYNQYTQKHGRSSGGSGSG